MESCSTHGPLPVLSAPTAAAERQPLQRHSDYGLFSAFSIFKPSWRPMIHTALSTTRDELPGWAQSRDCTTPPLSPCFVGECRERDFTKKSARLDHFLWFLSIGEADARSQLMAPSCQLWRLAQRASLFFRNPFDKSSGLKALISRGAGSRLVPSTGAGPSWRWQPNSRF